MKVRLDLPPVVLLVDTDKITPDQMDEIADALAEVSYKNSIFAKYPMEKGETEEEWSARVSPLISEDRSRKEKESMEAYLKRIFKDNNGNKSKLIFDTLVALAKIFNQPAVVKENYGKGSITQIKGFIREILTTCSFSVKDYE